ncbi:InlB B-repeat-containing protein [Bifidobacterium sp. B4142]|uniref:RCC1 domain-containing protein n=1 Tax=Bifidobacterium sp. B4142 TaxID=2817962 RepID=UPI00226B5C7D|nr:InlB B-repeat-containing protein [Bifidobacterium sp. B4142]MCX8687974.1 InlB B-repeat-containing protein [Bifidobacterium sp. B4142]
MRQRLGMVAALAFLLALSCTPALAGGTSSPDGTAVPATLDKQQGENPYRDDSPQAASSSSPLATSSPLSHTTPSPAAAPARTGLTDTTGSRPQAQSSQTWTVSFDPAGGSSIGGQTIPDGGQASRPSPDPSRDGYLFDGWFQGDVAYDFSQPVTGKVTLTARWTRTDTQHWTISPTQGPAAGGTKVTLTPPKPRGIRFSQISLNGFHSAAIRSDGNLYTWGNNSSGQLGDGTTSNQKRPILVDKPAGAPNGFTWKQTILGSYYSAAFGSDGNLYTWGDNSNGTLGDGTTTDRSRPVLVGKPAGAPDGFTWKQVSLGAWHSAAIGSDGNLYTWGRNSNGQLGRDTNITPANRPGLVGKPQGAPDGFTWKQASLGWFHSAAIGSDGNLYTWGRNDSGQLGDGTTTDRNKPAKLNGITWKQISLNNNFSAGIGSDGNLYAWGGNSSGQLGDDTTTNRSRPTLIRKPTDAPDGFTWKHISLGETHSAALGSDGNLFAWGRNNTGQLGDGTTTNRNRPVMVVFPGATTPTDVLFGQAKAMGGITANSDGTWQATTPAHAPGAVDVTVVWNRNGPQPDAHLRYTFIAPEYQVGFTSKDSSCPAPTGMPPSQAVTQDGQAERPQPDPKADGCLFDGWFQGDVAYDFTQPVTGKVTLTARWTKGDGRWTISPTQGPETGGTEVTLTPPAQRGIRFSQISSGEYHSVAIGSDGNLYAWGDNQYGQLGDGTNTNRSTPVMVGKPGDAPDGFIWKQVSSSFRHSAAIGSDGQLYAWGRNYYGQLGDGTTTNRTRPVKIGKPQGAPDGFTWKQISMGSDHSAAIGSDDNLYTWGWEDAGRLGRSTSITPYDRPGLVDKPTGATDTFAWKQISMGGHSAAIGSNGNLYTWGYNAYGQLGDGTTTDQARPVKIGKPQGAPNGFTWKQVSLGRWYSAALGSDGSLYTWGDNAYGQLGDGTKVDKHTPTPVQKPQGAPDGFTWQKASLGYSSSDGHSAAIGSDGNLYSWGSNGNGQLGREPAEAWPASRPGPVGFPGKPQATRICFDQTRQQGVCSAAGKNLTPNPDGTRNATTPAYTPGPVPVAIDWTQDGMPQETDTSNTYRYLSIASLPLTGGNGMLILLATGLLAAGAATAAKSQRQQARTAA